MGSGAGGGEEGVRCVRSVSLSLSLSLDGLPHVGFTYDGLVVVIETYDCRPVVGLRQGYVFFRLCVC